MKKLMWGGLGFLSLGVAYVGVILPGIPFSIPAVFAAYCFAKSSDKMHAWLYGHKLFGPFLTNWETKKVFPQKAKYMMLGMMAFALLCMIVFTGNWKAVAYSGTFMTLGALWGWRYPSTPEEYDRRKAAGEKIGLFK
jgi:hypothetical protein